MRCRSIAPVSLRSFLTSRPASMASKLVDGSRPSFPSRPVLGAAPRGCRVPQSPESPGHSRAERLRCFAVSGFGRCRPRSQRVSHSQPHSLHPLGTILTSSLFHNVWPIHPGCVWIERRGCRPYPFPCLSHCYSQPAQAPQARYEIAHMARNAHDLMYRSSPKLTRPYEAPEGRKHYVHVAPIHASFVHSIPNAYSPYSHDYVECERTVYLRRLRATCAPASTPRPRPPGPEPSGSGDLDLPAASTLSLLSQRRPQPPGSLPQGRPKGGCSLCLAAV